MFILPGKVCASNFTLSVVCAQLFASQPCCLRTHGLVKLSSGGSLMTPHRVHKPQPLLRPLYAICTSTSRPPWGLTVTALQSPVGPGPGCQLDAPGCLPFGQLLTGGCSGGLVSCGFPAGGFATGSTGTTGGLAPGVGSFHCLRAGCPGPLARTAAHSDRNLSLTTVTAAAGGAGGGACGSVARGGRSVFPTSAGPFAGLDGPFHCGRTVRGC